VNSPRLGGCAVIPADAGIQKPDWMPDQVRHDVQYPAACGGVVYLAGHCEPKAKQSQGKRDCHVSALLAMIDEEQVSSVNNPEAQLAVRSSQ